MGASQSINFPQSQSYNLPEADMINLIADSVNKEDRENKNKYNIDKNLDTRNDKEIKYTDYIESKKIFDELFKEIKNNINLYLLFDNFSKKNEIIVKDLQQNKTDMESLLKKNELSMYSIRDDINDTQVLIHKKKKLKSLIGKVNIFLVITVVVLCIINRNKLI